MVIRLFDFLFSLIGLILLIPLFLIVAFLIVFDSSGGVFYYQKRVGKDNKNFTLIKFRTMAPASDNSGLLTIGSKDQRVTRIGYYLRRYKIDELPQLVNVLIGSMSFVGPRPEVRKYVDIYNDEQTAILRIKPGITDYASIEFTNESEILSLSKDPERTYIEEIMPLKIRLNMIYINNRSVKTYFRIIFLTIRTIFSKG